MGCRQGGVDPPRPPAPTPVPKNFLLGCRTRRDFVPVPPSGHTKVRGGNLGLKTLLSLAQSCKGDGIPGMRTEGRFPFGFCLMGMGSGRGFCWAAFACPPCSGGGAFLLAAGTRRHRWAAGLEGEAPAQEGLGGGGEKKKPP